MEEKALEDLSPYQLKRRIMHYESMANLANSMNHPEHLHFHNFNKMAEKAQRKANEFREELKKRSSTK